MKEKSLFTLNPLMLGGLSLAAAIAVFASLSNFYSNNTTDKAEVNTSYTIPAPAVVATPAAALVQTQTPITPEDLTNQKSWQQVQVADGDTLAGLFIKLGLSPDQLHQILLFGTQINPLLALQAGQEIDFLIDGNKQLQQLTFSPTPLETMTLTANGKHFNLTVVKHQPTTQLDFASATIQHSLYAAGDQAGLDPKITNELTKVFSSQLSLAKNIQPGDQFRVLYNDLYAGSKQIGVGDMVAAQIITQKKTYTAIRYLSADGKARYYTANGTSLSGGGISFLRYPVNSPHISSYFSMHRFNPVLHIVRPHYGVDFAAPSGTPIHATANGVVEFAGVESGYGDIVILKHTEGYSTRYAHMSRFAHALRTGESVKEGQVIGYIGRTGTATGPNLHYEVRINNRPYNPLTVKLPQSPSLTHSQLKQFVPYAKNLLAKLEAGNPEAKIA